jgi:hypothetical protein
VTAVPAASPIEAIEEARQLCRRRLQAADLTSEHRGLLEAAIASAPLVPALPLPECVIERIAEEFFFMARADHETLAGGRGARSRYERLWKIATLQRFPAGQFEWEVSGLSRGDVLRVSPRELPRVVWFIARRMHGLAPVFFSHLNPRRAERSLVEIEANRSYYRMAQALEMQPHILGFGACSWFRSPGVHRVSPHLAWLSAVFVENGGLVVEAGRDDPDSGVLARSATRRTLYQSGKFVPTRGLVMWPREAMIAWARQHPELGDRS